MMNNNPLTKTVQLSKNDKLKLLNDRLSSMLKEKKIDPIKAAQHLYNNKTKESLQTNPKVINKEQGSKQKLQKQNPKEKLKNDDDDDKVEVGIQKKSKKQMKNQKILRKAAGQVWEDKTMQDWPQNDYRIFCGNLGNQVTDDILGSIFRRYSSFQMARVVRDRRTGKTRGYGFVSFLNPSDFLNALKQMNGKHVGNRPVKLMKSSWKDRNLNSAKNQFLPSDFQKNSQKQTFKICVDYKYVSPY